MGRQRTAEMGGLNPTPTTGILSTEEKKELGAGTVRCSDGDPRVSAEFRGVPHILNIPMGSENSEGFQNVPLHSDQF
jgi:hypothetical protein